MRWWGSWCVVSLEYSKPNIFRLMKKLILCVSVAFTTALSYQYVAANENAKKETTETTSKTVATAPVSVDDHISKVYSEINFGAKKLNFDVFKKAYYGYLNLRNEGKVNSNKNVLTVVDFSQPSSAHRLWVIDLNAKKLVINDYVAHGQGSGDLYATKFSNTSNSHQSSLGFYVTDDIYFGKHGKSLRLRGMDQGYNSAAYERAVVIHGADYVSDDFVAGTKRLGRSWGCPAVSQNIKEQFIETVKEGTVLFVYAPQQDYLQSSQWLTKKVSKFPSTDRIVDNGAGSTSAVSTIN